MVDLFSIARPILHSFDPEFAHGLTLRALEFGLGPKQRNTDPPELAVSLFGLTFPNPIGVAAGFDKNAQVPDTMLAMGFGFAEVGTVTPRPQQGNPKPRIFRLKEDRAVINRLGFNNGGLDVAAMCLVRRHGRPGLVGINLGANKDSSDRAADYALGLDRLYGFGAYFTINISSPNTPGLRALQSRSSLEDLLGRLFAVRTRQMQTGAAHKPLLLKVAPDLTQDDVQDIASIALETELDGLIISNTTIGHREVLTGKYAGETGGLSGAPLFAPSTELLGNFYALTQGKVPLVGVGGVGSGHDAYDKIKAGASLVQLYTALIYQGPNLVTQIKKDLVSRLRADGFSSISEAVGIAAK